MLCSKLRSLSKHLELLPRKKLACVISTCVEGKGMLTDADNHSMRKRGVTSKCFISNTMGNIEWVTFLLNLDLSSSASKEEFS